MTPTRNAAQLFAECLVAQEVEIIFAIPGAKIDALFDALLDTPIKLITCRHEQNAAFMAAAYGRLSGKPGVVLVTSGPGVANLATGLLTATTEGDPVVAIGGNVSRNMRLKESHQGTDNVKLMEAVTKWRAEVIAVDTIPEVLENAFRKALLPHSGAVFISLPQDLLTETTDIVPHHPAPPVHYGVARSADIEHAANLINSAKKPILFLGLEASRPHNSDAIRQLLSKSPMPTICTYQGAGVVSRDLLSCFIGRVGLFHNQPGDQLIEAADLIVTVGYNPVEYDPEIWNANKAKKILHIDYVPTDIHTAYSPILEIMGEIADNILQLSPLLNKSAFLQSDLVNRLQAQLTENISHQAKESAALIHPLAFIHHLREALDDDALVISDIGTHYMWLARYFLSFEPRHLLFSNGQQTLGVALPWAMGARLVFPNKKIVSISGDGGFLFSAMELETAVREKLPLVHFVWCDGTYNMVMMQQLKKYHRESAVHLGHVDIVKFAESFGARGMRLDHAHDIAHVLEEAFACPGPVIIEVHVDYSDNAGLFAAAHDAVLN